MPGHIPVMLGSLGLADSELFVLSEHAPVIIGRSRNCDVCFYRFRKYLALAGAEREKVEDQYAQIGRTHIRVSLAGTVVTCECMSAAAAFANGVRMVKPVEHDLAKGPLALRLSSLPDTFTLTLLDEQRVEELLMPSQVPPGRRPAPPRTGEDITPQVVPALAEAKPPAAPAAAVVTFPTSDGRKRSLPLPPGDEMLAFLEGAGAACADRGCGMGSCQTCKLRAVAGRVNITTITEYDTSGLRVDEFLPCCSSAKGPVEVEKA